ncbi:MAG TPA: two-component regulator propeller domain-containing protein [Candidatus Hydrogenedentes bacterium]|nr:two-component regulator propeller domain-containing protein [Candidatus Hydrogenedentota bacterium]HPC15017.1 two-component regulator propeller domain-containing protein [Candidatus Hydrogenedentota bacterium]HRT19122.1 two-component regulator propeller domain-containing protein [Candidatus Hydrogenedentota bacterium]HRT64051.1 two-component regulator propeller domain-containing protein [Candidatus Hydrogenedentota bacterium]
MRQTVATALAACALAGTAWPGLAEETAKASKPPLRIKSFAQEIAVFYDETSGLPDEKIHAVAGFDATEPGGGASPVRHALTAGGVASFDGARWRKVEGLPETGITHIAVHGNHVFAVDRDAVHCLGPDGETRQMPLPPDAKITCIEPSEHHVWLGTEQGLCVWSGDSFSPVEELNALLREGTRIAAVKARKNADAGEGVAVAASSGLFLREMGSWRRLFPQEGARSWTAVDVRGIAWDSAGGLWFASPHGVGCLSREGQWNLYTPEDGLPYNDFTFVASAQTGERSVWFATTKGAIRFDGKSWEYRQGRRWLPADHVYGICPDPDGGAWFATRNGVGRIQRKPMTLREKAAFYEDEIDKYHRRTEYEYVLEARLKRPGDKSESKLHDTDNDGLWTSMYGAGECFAYAATKDPLAKKRAQKAFEALRFLQTVTQGGDPPALKGFVARCVLPADGPNPNETEYTRERDERIRNSSDALWKIITPRWPLSADRKWYWKCDTSSDELDGHYFFHGRYYDLVADTDEEKQRVREVVGALTDHLVEHDFNLVDWDGQRTRWAVFSPSQLNRNPLWMIERGLNSLSILSYLATAHHICGDTKYRDAFDMLVRDHGYAMNLMTPKIPLVVGGGNQSDDEMAFMNFYNLILYSHDPKVTEMARYSFKQYWDVEKPELNPFFNFAYAAMGSGASFSDQYQTVDLSPDGEWLEQSVETLVRFPLDRCNWAHENSHRKDLVPLPAHVREGREARGKGFRRNGFVLPVDERHFNYWNTDPWQLDYPGDGRELAHGGVFLLPYYMGLYHGFIAEE